MKFTIGLVGALVLSISGMGVIYRLQTQEYQREIDRLQILTERQTIAKDLTLALERYRRQSSAFRKMSDLQISEVKSSLKSEIRKSISRLDQLEPISAETQMGQKLEQQLADFMILSTKLEPTLFLKDVFLKPEAQESHQAMATTVKLIRDSAQKRESTLQGEFQSAHQRLNQLLLMLGLVVVALSAVLLLSVFWIYIRPLNRVLQRAREINLGRLKREVPRKSKGPYAEIEKAMDDLAQVTESHQRERHQFVTAVATDLRVPLIPIQTAASLLGSASSQLGADERAAASDVVRRSAIRLSKSLDDLTDTLQIDSGSIRLDEKIVDLRDVIGSIAQLFNGPGATTEIRAFQPAMPIWALVDPARMERVILNLVSKIAQFAPQGTQIDVALSKAPARGAGGYGAEILIYESAKKQKQDAVRPTGPEQELLRHWISENGFGLALAQRLVEAHGGSVTAAGVAGTAVVFAIRIPEDRIVSQFSNRPGVKTVLQDPQVLRIENESAASPKTDR